MAWTTLMRLAPAALKLFKAAKKGKKIKRPKGKAVVKEEVSHLTDEQKTFIDRHRRKGKKQGEGGDWQSKKSFDGKQKVTKQKKKKVDDLDPKESRKYEDLRKKQEKMEAEGRQHRQEQLKQRDLYGDWLPTSKGAIRKRLESSKFFSKLKSNTKKKKSGKQETYTPPPIEGIPRPKKR